MDELTSNQKRILKNGYRWDVCMYSEQDRADMTAFVAQGLFRQLGRWNDWGMTEKGREFVRQTVREDANWRSELLAEAVMGLMNTWQHPNAQYQNDKDFAALYLELCGVQYNVSRTIDDETGEDYGDWWELNSEQPVSK